MKETMTDIIGNLENASSTLEEMTQIPEAKREELVNKIEEVLNLVSDYADEYGEDPLDDDVDSED